MFKRFRRLFDKPKEPKYKIRSRTRIRGWIVCECNDCKCSNMSKWEDRQCIPCWGGVHMYRKQLNNDNEENK